MLIGFHISSFLMLYDSGYTSRGDSETIVSYKQLEMRDEISSFSKFDF